MAHWNSSESGILRKKKKSDDIEKLSIFGYACKLFKDDEKALHIDQGKHLIPWMGCESLKVDRYDCRGHLSDSSQFEASREDYDTARWLGLSENERKLEQLCDEERYYSSLNNEEEEEMYKEEELKRNKTNEFQYSYDVPTNPDEQKGIPTVSENDIDEQYIPTPDLDVPVGIEVPKTMKEYARIEKTAIFVSTQGPQMEILIKAKQNDNPQFSFLNQKDSLYRFYRHVLDAVKNRRYRSNIAKSDANTSNTSTDENSDHYLHPSLVSSASPSTEVHQLTIPSIPYRPDANCAYSQLVSRIQGTTNLGATTNIENKLPGENQDVQSLQVEGAAQPDMSSSTYEQQQQYYQYYVQRHYYEYYKQYFEKPGVSGDLSSNPEMALNPNMQALLQHMMYTQYLQQSQAQQQQQPTNPYAQIVSNSSKESPISKPLVDKPDIAKDAVIYGANKEPTVTSNQQKLETEVPVITVGNPNDSIKKAALSLIQNYASDSEDDTSEDEEKLKEDFKMPDEDTKVVIDKMACYVVKNGMDFEKIVRSREDPRFVFLKEDHEFYPYYRHKVEEEKEKIRGAVDKPDDIEESEETSKVNSGKTKEKKIIAPVSFSIKKPKEDPPKEMKSALPMDDESDEDDSTSQEATSAVPVIPQPPTLVTSNTAKNVSHIEALSVSKEKESDSNICVVNENSENNLQQIEENESDKGQLNVETKEEEKEERTVTKRNGVLDEDDSIMEMIDLTEDEKKVDLVKNADIFDIDSEKDKTVKENRALQLERRRKALAFLKLKSASNDSDQVPTTGKTTIPTIDLSNIQSPKKKYISDSSEEKTHHRKRSRSRTKERDHHKSKRSRESEKTVSRKDREKSRKSKTPKVDRNTDSGVSEKEEGEMTDDTDDKYRKSSHKKKKLHKRKHSKSKHSSKSKKKSKKKESREVSSSDSEQSIHS